MLQTLLTLTVSASTASTVSASTASTVSASTASTVSASTAHDGVCGVPHTPSVWYIAGNVGDSILSRDHQCNDLNFGSQFKEVENV